MAGALFLLAAGVIHGHLLPRAQEDIASLQRASTGLRERLARERTQAAAPRGATPLAQLHGRLPPVSGQAQLDALARLHGAAQACRLALEQGSYRLEMQPGETIARFDITVTAKGSYPQLRRFILRALGDDATLALESMRLSRQSIGDARIDGELRFSVFLGAP
ncbi:MAG: hypothetical protein J0H00_09160 [Burkholderiales bacterium]|nr:hypothetical protein [Burkholderiales bacterium]OJX06758.1 MAG: hypothetical protein BGO72_00210 [Burkholderiales bacterium 70-64]